ncbi:MAG: hypothetical protein ACXWLD_12200 [Rhizomicrobium sp.]
MPLQNRVNPLGELFASSARGTLFGNRGGKFHRDDRTLGRRRYASRQWICCVLKFKNRQRDVWGRYYTELFFLDEPTALSAGHRPCFECRRADATAFAAAWARGQGLLASPRAPDMDRMLHEERLDGRAKRVHRRNIDDLPDGAFIVMPDGGAAAVRGETLLRWRPEGYDRAFARPHGATVDVLTPPSILAALSNGYQPAWHESAALVSRADPITKRR